MSKSCWLIFEHKQSLRKPAESVGWENSFAPLQSVPKSWGLAFLHSSCVAFTRFPCCFSHRPRSDLITTIPDWFLHPLLDQSQRVLIPWFYHLFGPEPPRFFFPLILELGNQGLCFKPQSVKYTHLFLSFTYPLIQQYLTILCPLNTFFILYVFEYAIPLPWDLPLFMLHF